MADTLKELCRDTPLKEGDRVYRVVVDSKEHYVTATSPGQAALTVCEVTRCTYKECYLAMCAAMGEQMREGLDE